VATDASAERIERLLEPFALVGDELMQPVPLGLELANPLFESLRVLTCRLRFAGELRGEVRQCIAVLFEFSSGRGELDLELRYDALLAAPPRRLRTR